jgi:peptide/nickel transport system ATP-binding protein
MTQESKETILEVKNLTIHYITEDGVVKAVNDISFSLNESETLGLAGETGAGKTTTALGLMGLIPEPPGKVIGGQILFHGKDLLKMGKSEMRKYRGKELSMIFQDPMTALNPVLTVGDQIAEVVRLHEKLSRADAERKAAEMLEMVGIPSERMVEYPNQFSGGMKQRVIIAIALACNPSLIIADEPTTALDVTIQAQVLDLMGGLQRRLHTAMIMITHDLGVLAEICDRVAIMYAGQIVEIGSLEDIYDHTLHPYTKGLFGSLPDLNSKVNRLTPIYGLMPDPTHLPTGCPFHPRCDHRMPECETVVPQDVEVSPGHLVKCLLYK